MYGRLQSHLLIAKKASTISARACIIGTDPPPNGLGGPCLPREQNLGKLWLGGKTLKERSEQRQPAAAKYYKKGERNISSVMVYTQLPPKEETHLTILTW